MRSVRASTKRSWMPLVTISREDAVQRCPVEKNAPLVAHSTAILTSASSSTTSGFLPPISSCTFFIGRRSGRGRRDLATDCNRPRERYRSDVGMPQQSLANLTASPHDEVEDAGRQSGSRNDLRKSVCRAGHEIGWLEHHAIAISQRRRNLPGRNRDRKVPRRDQCHDADRFARHLDVYSGSDAGDLLAGRPHRLPGEEGENLSSADNLADALRQRLALLARQQTSELVLARQNLVGDLLQRLITLLRRRARIGRKCRFGGSYRRIRYAPILKRPFALTGKGSCPSQSDSPANRGR